MRIESGQRGRGSAIRIGSIAMAIAVSALVSGTPARGEAPSAPGPEPPVAVLSGAYACDVVDFRYYEPGASEPTTFRETSDRLSIASTGGVVPSAPGAGGRAAIGPGYGGHPVVGAAADIGNLFTGHSFNGGMIEDCLRFAGAIAATARGQGCVVSDVRHRPLINGAESASLTFVCEGPVATELHAIGELSRAVINLKPLPTP